MIYSAILIASLVLLAAFAVERLGRATGIPSVIVMIGIGLALKPLLSSLGFVLDGLDMVVPVLGTVGLVLIVLEGALDIRLRRDALKAAGGPIAMATAGFLSCLAVFTLLAAAILPLTLFQAMIFAVPFAVISSAVAIPSSEFLPARGREFVVYESSFSDILGVLVFFALVNSGGSVGGVLTGLLGGGFLSLLLAIAFSVGLVLLLMRIDGHIRFIPLLAGLFGLYAAGKLLHLSPLILVLLFGLALNNPKLITRYRPFRGWMDETYEDTLNGFKLLILELTFAVRGFFFILLGYWTDPAILAAPRTWIAALMVLAVVYGLRHLMLRGAEIALAGPLTWLAPRGLITILLYLNAKDALPMPDYMDGAVMLVVLASAALIGLARWQAGKLAASA